MKQRHIYSFNDLQIYNGLREAELFIQAVLLPGNDISDIDMLST